MRTFGKFLTIGIGMMAATLPVSMAHACQGPQFETTTIIASKAPRETTPDGMTQLKIRISERQQEHNAGRRDYFVAEIINEEKGRQRVAVLIPGTTSCGRVALPQAGDFYIYGQFAKGSALKSPMTMQGSAIFSPVFYTRRHRPLAPRVRD